MPKTPTIAQRIVDLFQTLLWMIKFFFLSMIGQEPQTPEERLRSENERKRQAFYAKMQKPINLNCGPGG